MLHVYYGNGKGKTTAAFGLALRQIGQGKRVLILQFLKDGNSGEMTALKTLQGVTAYAKYTSSKFYFQMNEEEKMECVQEQQQLFQIAQMESQEYDCIILDEILDVIGLHILCEKELIRYLSTMKERVEIVITGRNPSSNLRTIADYEIEMIAHQHPYEKGIPARIGVEY